MAVDSYQRSFNAICKIRGELAWLAMVPKAVLPTEVLGRPRRQRGWLR